MFINNNGKLQPEYEYLSDQLTRMAELHAKVVPLASIVLSRSIMVAGKRKIIVKPGDWIKVERGQLVDCLVNPTHEIKECRGTLINTKFSLLLVDLKTREETEIKI